MLKNGCSEEGRIVGRVWYTLCMKKTAKTVKKTAVQATKKRSTKKRQSTYTYDTELGVLAADYKIPIGKFSPTMKLGDFFETIGEVSMCFKESLGQWQKVYTH